MKKLLVTALIISTTLSIGTVEEGRMVLNGGFENDLDENGLADYWEFSGDEGVTATWELDRGFVGQRSQKLTCANFNYLSPASHAMLCQVNTVQLEEGQWYRISFAIKQEGILSQVVNVSILNTMTWNDCGLKESFRVTHEWKRFEFVFQATETIIENVRLQFWYTSIGTLWLDDVQLESSEQVTQRFAEEVPPTNAVNLLPNSSFECGISGWGSIADLPDWIGNLNLLVGEVDTSTAQFHQSSFKIALTEKNMPVFHFDYFQLYRTQVKAPLLASRGWITVEPGADYTLSAYMKADSDELIGVLAAQQAFEEKIQQQVRLTTEWTRYSFTFSPKTEQIFIALGLDLEASGKERGTVWIDGVQFEKNDHATPYTLRATIEVGLETDRLGNLFNHGVEPKMMATIFNTDEITHSILLYLKTTDFDDVIVHEASLPVDVSPMRAVKVPIHSGVQRKGFYRLHLSCEEAEVTLIGSLRFAIIEPYTKSDSLFGINHAYPWPHLLDLSKQIGVCWVRDWSLKWQDVEPEKGNFDFTQTDYQINRILEAGLNVLPLLPFPSSNWSSSAGPEVDVTGSDIGYRELMAYMPRDMGEFATYIRETVQHYKEQLHVWEILNEPIYSSYVLPQDKGYEISDYLQLLQLAQQEVEAADSDALVIGGIDSDSDSIEEFINMGGLFWIDIFNLHIFPDLKAPDAFEESFRRLRELVSSVRADVPIWLTEGGYYADDDKAVNPYYSSWLKPLDSEIEAAEDQVKFNVLLLTYGVEKIFYHSGYLGSLNNENLSGIFFEWAAAPRKMLVSQSAMANLLSPPINAIGPIENSEELIAYGFESDGRTVIVAWVQEGTEEREISLAGKPWRAIELQGEELEVDRISLTKRPVYFVVEGSMPDELPW